MSKNPSIAALQDDAKLSRTASIPAGNPPFQGNDTVGVYGKLSGADFEAC